MVNFLILRKDVKARFVNNKVRWNDQKFLFSRYDTLWQKQQLCNKILQNWSLPEWISTVRRWNKMFDWAKKIQIPFFDFFSSKTVLYFCLKIERFFVYFRHTKINIAHFVFLKLFKSDMIKLCRSNISSTITKVGV